VITTSSSAKLGFSSNALSFDTAFTTIGSVTQYFQVYNNNSNAVTVSSIRLGGGNNSPFRLNVDGVAGKVFGSTTIHGKDSLFVFVAVTVNPNDQNSPLIIRDSILFETNGNQQKVMLEAWGQDAHYIKPKPGSFIPLSDGTGLYYSIIPCNTTWGLTDNKPYVIYDYAVVDSGCTLTILPGVKVYMHINSVLWVYNDGTLNIQGSAAEPVVFQGDNLLSSYQYNAGQWGKIWLSPGSKDNTMDWAVIKNGIIGVEADTNVDRIPTLAMSHCLIENMTGAAIYGLGSIINADNCVFANCQQYCGAFIYGGTYQFNQCTFADYWAGTNQRTSPAVLINNNYEPASGGPQIVRPLSAYFGNCIIYGNSQDSEIGLDSAIIANYFHYKFDHCLLKVQGSYSSSRSFSSHNIKVVLNQNPFSSFSNPNTDVYTILAKGPAAGTADSSIVNMYPIDIKNMNRLSMGEYDIGAYEH